MIPQLIRLAAVLTMLVAMGCETQAPFAECELDEEVTSKGICTGGDEGAGNTSCVVTRHPHCVQSICLSHFGSDPFCSNTCTGDADCLQGGFCWEFAEGEKYCVPADRKNIEPK